MNHPRMVTSLDVALLRRIDRDRSLVAAAKSLGISRDQAVYRIRRLARAFGGPVVRAVRGGREHGGSLLTPLGDRIVHGGFDTVELLDARPVAPIEPANLLRGTFRAGPPPEIVVSDALRLRVAFEAPEGARVAALLDPEAIVVARAKFPSSARNVVAARVRTVRKNGRGPGRTLVVEAGGVPLRVAITDEPVGELGLVRGAPVWLYVKATALRRVGPTRGSPRS